MRIERTVVVRWMGVLAFVIGPVATAALGASAEDPAATATVTAAPAAPSVSRLDRIARGLQSPAPDAARPMLRLDVGLQVFGAAPAAVTIHAADVAIGAPVYGAPTHDEILTMWTPPALRSTAPFRRLRQAVPLGR